MSEFEVTALCLGTIFGPFILLIILGTAQYWVRFLISPSYRRSLKTDKVFLRNEFMGTAVRVVRKYYEGEFRQLLSSYPKCPFCGYVPYAVRDFAAKSCISQDEIRSLFSYQGNYNTWSPLLTPPYPDWDTATLAIKETGKSWYEEVAVEHHPLSPVPPEFETNYYFLPDRNRQWIYFSNAPSWLTSQKDVERILESPVNFKVYSSKNGLPQETNYVTQEMDHINFVLCPHCHRRLVAWDVYGVTEKRINLDWGNQAEHLIESYDFAFAEQWYKLGLHDLEREPHGEYETGGGPTKVLPYFKQMIAEAQNQVLAERRVLPAQDHVKLGQRTSVSTTAATTQKPIDILTIWNKRREEWIRKGGRCVSSQISGGWTGIKY